MTLAEAAATLGVSVETVRRLIRDGKLAATKMRSGRVLVSPDLAPPAKDGSTSTDLTLLWQERQSLAAALKQTRGERDALKAEVEALQQRLGDAIEAHPKQATLLSFARSELTRSLDGHDGIQKLIVAARRKSKRRLWLWRISA